MTSETKTYTVESLAVSLNMPPDKLALRIKLMERLKALPAPADAVKVQTAVSLLGMQQQMAAKQLTEASTSNDSTQQSPDTAPSSDEGGQLQRLSVAEINTIAKQHGITQTLAKELENAAFLRNLEVLYLREQTRMDLESDVKQAVRTQRQMEAVEQENRRIDDMELELLSTQEKGRLESLDKEFGLGLQSTIDRLKAETEARAARQIKREEWLRRIESGEVIPVRELEEAIASDPFVKRAYYLSVAPIS